MQRIKIVEVSGSPSLLRTFGHIIRAHVGWPHHHIRRLLEVAQSISLR